MNKNILCVDDEPHILEAFKHIFRKEFKVYVADGGGTIHWLQIVKRPLLIGET